MLLWEPAAHQPDAGTELLVLEGKGRQQQRVSTGGEEEGGRRGEGGGGGHVSRGSERTGALKPANINNS